MPRPSPVSSARAALRKAGLSQSRLRRQRRPGLLRMALSVGSQPTLKTPPTVSSSTTTRIRTHSAAATGWPRRRQHGTKLKAYPRIGMSLSYISSNDGQSKTLMVSENLHTWYWTYDAVPFRRAAGSPNHFVQDDASTIQDAKHLFGFVWKNNTPASRSQMKSWERINGDQALRQESRTSQ